MSIDESLPTQQLSPGAQLAAARQALGLTLEEVAQALKITLHFVRAIEADDYQRLPGDTFARGYLRLYAELLSLDPEPLLQALSVQQQGEPPSLKPQLLSQTVQAAPKRRLRPAGLLVALVLVGAGGYWWLQSSGNAVVADSAQVASTTETAQSRSSAAASAVAVIEESASTENSGQPAQGAGEALHLPAEQDAAPSVISLVEQLDTELDPHSAEAPSHTDTLPASPSSADSAAGEIGPVEIVVPAERSLVKAPVAESAVSPEPAVVPGLDVLFSEDCWLRVTDGSGRELFSGVKNAGTRLELEVEKPFKVRFGNAAGVAAIHYQQQPLELEQAPGRSVAVLHVN